MLGEPFGNKRNRDASLGAEIQDYLDRETAENIAAGMTPDDARSAAQRKLGNATRVKEDTRAAWGFVWFENLWQDIRHGAHMFAKNPGFTAVAVLSIALGTGANCAMFSGADGLLLRPLPVPHPDELYAVGSRIDVERMSYYRISYPDFRDLQQRGRSFSQLIGYETVGAGFTQVVTAVPKVKQGLLVTPGFFETAGVEPALGRRFRDDENRIPGRDPVVVLSHELWLEEFHGDRDVLNRKIQLSGVEFTIIGVLPEYFTGMHPIRHAAFYVPIMMWPQLYADPKVDPLQARDVRFMEVRGRLSPRATVESTRAELMAIAKSLEAEYPATNRKVGLDLDTELGSRVNESPDVARMSAMALTLSMAVLFAACVNLIGLLASRAPVRAREIALRLAIGASRGRLIRQLVTENLMIAAAGSLLGIAVGAMLIRYLQAYHLPTDLPVIFIFEMDRRALTFSLAAAVLCVLIFGLIPAVQTVRTDLTSALKSGGARGQDRAHFRGRNAIVSIQVAVALVLLTVAVAMQRGFHFEYGSGPGYRTDHLLTMNFDPGLIRRSPAEIGRFYRDLLDRAREIPGVRSVTLTSRIPMAVNGSGTAVIVPEGYRGSNGISADATYTHFSAAIDENYFDTLAIPLIKGRAFLKSDDVASPRVAVVNQALAAHYWPGQDPVGKRFRIGSSEGPWVGIVGLTPTSKYLWPGEGPVEFLYFPFRQSRSARMTLVAQSEGDPASLSAPLRKLVFTLDPQQPIYDIRTMEDFYQTRVVVVGQQTVQLIGWLGIMGVALSMVGLYGLVAYSVNRRTREIGIRMALGATPRSVLRLVLRNGAILAGVGTALGLIGSIGSHRALQVVFPMTSRVGYATYLLVAVGLVAITMLAAYIPARRASRVDPNVALRDD